MNVWDKEVEIIVANTQFVQTQIPALIVHVKLASVEME